MARDMTTADTFAREISNLADRVEALLLRQTPDSRSRILIALAGVPGSGKSTVSNALLDELALRKLQHITVVPMDGFHYSKKTLATFPDPDLAMRRRGAPFTFDAEAFVQLVKDIKDMPVTADGEAERFLHAPSFDHAVKDPVQDAISISSRSRLIIVEGNYTLLNQSPWNDVSEIWEERWFVDAPAETAEERLIQRHLAAGIESSRPVAAKRVAENDLPNGDLVRSLLIKPDVVVVN